MNWWLEKFVLGWDEIFGVGGWWILHCLLNSLDDTQQMK